MQQSGGRIRRLTNVETLSVALVTRGANKKRVALTKSQGDGVTTTELLAQIIQKGDMPMSDEDIDKLCQEGGVDAQGAETFKAMLKLGQSFSDDQAFGKLVKEKLPSLLGLDKAPAAAPAPQEDGDGEKPKPEPQAEENQNQPPPKEDGKEPEVTQKTDDVKKMDDMKVALEKAEKTAADATAKLGTLEEVMKSQKETIEKMQSDLAKERDERNLAEWVVKADADLKFIPGKTAKELGDMFHKLEKSAGKEVAQMQFDVQKSASEALSKSQLFRASGAPVRGSSAKSAYEALQEKADALIEKADTGKPEAVRKASAMAKAIEQNPELYKAYLDENDAQTGKR